MPPDQVLAIGALIVSLLSTVGLLTKQLVEAGRTRVETARLRRDMADVRHELKPNSGGSARDALDRTESATTRQTELITEIREVLRGLVVDVRRLAQVDVDDRARARSDHEHLWQAINDLQDRK